MKALITSLLLISFVGPGCHDEEVSPRGDFIPIEVSGATLAAELDLPAGEGPFPALIMVHGSGQLDRHLYEGSARNYTNLGIAVLRYDKRGVGQSSGRYHPVNAGNSPEVFPILADDVVTIARFLTEHPDIDPLRIGLIGASQAGWIMPLAAVNSSHISCMVSISGAASSVGVSDYFDSIAEGGFTEEEIDQALANFNGVHGFDPRPSLEALPIPALWIYGGKDTSNPTAHDMAILEDIKVEFNKDFTIHLFPNLDHDLLDVDTNQPIPDTQVKVNEWLVQKLAL